MLCCGVFCIAHSSAKNGYFGEYLNVFVMFCFGFVRRFGADARGFSGVFGGFYSSCNRNKNCLTRFFRILLFLSKFEVDFF